MLTRHQLLHKIVDSVRALFGAISICFAMGSICILFFWFLNSSYFLQLSPFRSEPVIVHANDKLDSTILVVGTGKAVFRRWIETENGNTIYTYPEYRSDLDNDNYINISIQYIPDLPKGTYVIKGEIFYKPNPIKVGEIQLVLSKFTLK